VAAEEQRIFFLLALLKSSEVKIILPNGFQCVLKVMLCMTILQRSRHRLQALALPLAANAVMCDAK